MKITGWNWQRGLFWQYSWVLLFVPKWGCSDFTRQKQSENKHQELKWHGSKLKSCSLLLASAYNPFSVHSVRVERTMSSHFHAASGTSLCWGDIWWVKLEKILVIGLRHLFLKEWRSTGWRNHPVQICITCRNNYYKHHLSLYPRPYETKQEEIGWESFLPKVCIIIWRCYPTWIPKTSSLKNKSSALFLRDMETCRNQCSSIQLRRTTQVNQSIMMGFKKAQNPYFIRGYNSSWHHRNII